MSTPPDAPLLAVRDLHKAYNGRPAVAGLSFDVAPGDILGLLGPNGAGKTTTIRCIAGIIAPDRGRIEIAGHDLAAHPAAAKHALGYIPDEPRLFDELTVAEHLRFFAAAYGLTNWQAEADRLIAHFDLADHRDKLAQDLSRGMRQKVATCCAFLHDPALIVLDEPLTGLDPRGIRTMKEAIRSLADAGRALLISSHLLDVVEDLCNKLLIVHHGRSLFLGPLADARAAFADAGLNTDASLEDLFLHATGSTPPADAVP